MGSPKEAGSRFILGRKGDRAQDASAWVAGTQRCAQAWEPRAPKGTLD